MLCRRVLFKAGLRLLNHCIDFGTVGCGIGHRLSPPGFVALRSTQIIRTRNAAPMPTEIRKELNVRPPGKLIEIHLSVSCLDEGQKSGHNCSHSILNRSRMFNSGQTSNTL
jgi:hypothetical protein